MIGIVTKSRKEHLVVQTRELACTQELLPQVIGRGKFILCVCVCVCVCERERERACVTHANVLK